MSIECPECHFINPDDTQYCRMCSKPIKTGEDFDATLTLEIPIIELPRGTILASRYEIIEELGKGGMGRVYRAFDKKLDEEIALKLIKPEIASDKEIIERFSNELKLARKISHRNVVRMYELMEDENIHFITMEYVPGQDLKKFVRSSGQLTIETTLSIAKQLCEGLAEAHSFGVVHRDLKPSNIMIDKEGNARIMDFGLALSLKTIGSSEAGAMIGTPKYMSPEQVEGKKVDQCSDIYSLGVILYEMVTGRAPFSGDTPIAIGVKHKSEIPEDPRVFNAQVPSDLSRVILVCMEKNREKRYQHAQELLTELSKIELGIPIQAVPQSSDRTPPFMRDREEPAEIERHVFVAREQELERLGNLLKPALSGKGHVAFITGEAGSGKTTLIKEFARRSMEAHPDLIVLFGNCNSQTGIGDPYLPFREVLSLLTGELESRWTAGTISKEHACRLWNLLPLAIESLLNSGPSLIESFISRAVLVAHATNFVNRGTDWIARLKSLVERKEEGFYSSDLHQSDLFEQYINVLQVIEQKYPLLLLLDDLQWADKGSVSLLFHLGRRIEANRILIIGAYRPDEVAMGRSGERHPMEPLINEFKRTFGDPGLKVGQNGARKFMDDFLDSEPNKLGSIFRDTLYKQTKGHPLFTIELLRNMQEQGMLVKNKKAQWVEGKALDWERLPAQVEATIGERLGQLSGELREVLAVASVEGEEFTAEVVSPVLGADDLKMVRLLSSELDKKYRLINALGIRKINGQRLSIYQFRHILFQKYLYNSLDETERVHLHEKIGSVLEELYGEHSFEIAVQLVRHFQQARLAEKEIEYLEKAGEMALERYANQEAIDFVTRAIDLDAHMETSRQVKLQRARWEQQLGEAYLGLDRKEESSAHLKRALGIMDRPLPTSKWRLIFRIVGQVLCQVLHRIWPARFVARTQDSSGIYLKVARAYEQLSEICYYALDRNLGYYALLRGLNLAERVTPSPELARGYVNLIIGAGVLRLHKIAETYSRKALETAKKVDQLPTLGYTLLVTSTYYLGIGEWAKVKDASTKANDIFHRVGDRRQWEVSFSTQGQQLYYQGEYYRSAEIHKAIYESALLRDDKQNQIWGLAGQAIAFLRLGELDEAKKYMNLIDFKALNEGHPFEKMWVYSLLALVRLRQNEWGQALQEAEKSLQLYGQSVHRTAALKPYFCVAEVFLSLLETSSNQPSYIQKKLAHLAKQACKSLNKYARMMPIGQPAAWLWQGLLDWLDGKSNRARKSWQRSINIAERMEMPHELGLAHYEMGRHFNGLAKQKHLSSAIEIFNKIGATYDLARVKAEIEQE